MNCLNFTIKTIVIALVATFGASGSAPDAPYIDQSPDGRIVQLQAIKQIELRQVIH